SSRAAEQIRERFRLLIAALRQHVRLHTRRRDREQLGAYVDGTEEHQLTPLELGTEAHHRMEDRPSQLACVSFGITHVSSEFAEFGERTWHLAFAHPARRIPRRIELHHSAKRCALFGAR